MMLKIYHNTRCKKSRAGLKYLQDTGRAFEIVEYLKMPLHDDLLRQLILKLGIEPFALVRTQEALYKTNLKGKNLTADEWVKIMVQNPKLIRRPLIESDTRAVIGDPPENIERLFA